MAGIFLNALLATIKITAGWLGHADALIADGVESTLDVFSSTMIWLALKYAERPQTKPIPMGMGKWNPSLGWLVPLFCSEPVLPWL